MIMAADASEAVNNAYNKLKMISQDPEIRACSEARELWILGQAIRESEARKEGREEGIEIGREEGMAIAGRKVAINLVALGMDDETISKVTGLPQEEITKLREQ
jgi:predicted transposase/invertase (TIGR01784 family)